jgi:hypothetical protein
MAVEVMLYSREGCCLCDDARTALLALGETIPLSIVEVDITTDPALEKQMFDRIPVITFGQVTLQAPIDPLVLRRAVLQVTRRSV